MPASTAKRLILYRFNRQPMEALVHAERYLQADNVELMTAEGNLQVIDYASIKALCFASEGAPADLFSSAGGFERRPKIPGLWVSFRFRDDDTLEGVLPHNLLEWPAQGFLLTPPRANSYRQRVFIPRLALAGTVLLGTVGKGSPAAAKGPKKAGGGEDRQMSIFDSVFD